MLYLLLSLYQALVLLFGTRNVYREKKIIASAEKERYRGRLADWELPDCGCMRCCQKALSRYVLQN